MKKKGFSFQKSKSGDLIPKPGYTIKPHRIELLSEKSDLNATDFFNFGYEDADNPSSIEQLRLELKMAEDWLSGKTYGD